MPAVIDTPELIEYVDTHELTTHELTIERPQQRRASPGFWRMLGHRMTQHLTPMPYERHAPSRSPHRPFEAPMDRLAREYPIGANLRCFFNAIPHHAASSSMRNGREMRPSSHARTSVS